MICWHPSMLSLIINKYLYSNYENYIKIAQQILVSHPAKSSHSVIKRFPPRDMSHLF